MVAKLDVCVRGVLCIAVLAAAWLFPSGAHAQAIVDARTLEFLPSPDHDRVTDGVAHVTFYSFEVFAVGESTPRQMVELGKPSPGADGYIRLDFVDRLSSPLIPGQEYQTRVTASGPGGTATSELSNVFSFTPTCTPVLSPPSASLGAAAADGIVTVTVAAGCDWTAVSSASWLTIESGTSGTGPGTVTFDAAANTGTGARSANLTVAGRTFPVTQAGIGCSYTVSPTTRTSPAAGEAVSVSVTTGSGCTWTRTSNASWLTFDGATNRTGGGTVTVTVAANTGTSQRTAAATIAGRTLQVTQPGSPGCTYTVTPSSISVTASGGDRTASVNTGSGCTWAVSSVPSWITLPGGTRTGPGTVTLRIAANDGGARNATLRIANRTLGVSQTKTTLGAPTGLRVVGSADEND
jgi:hypothetical protein